MHYTSHWAAMTKTGPRWVGVGCNNTNSPNDMCLGLWYVFFYYNSTNNYLQLGYICQQHQNWLFCSLFLLVQVENHVVKNWNQLSLFSNYLAQQLIHANNVQMTLKQRIAISWQILHIDPLLYSKNCFYKCAAAHPVFFLVFWWVLNSHRDSHLRYVGSFWIMTQVDIWVCFLSLLYFTISKSVFLYWLLY